MKNSKIIVRVLAILLFCNTFGNFTLIAQIPAPTVQTVAEKLAAADKLFDEAITLYKQGTAESDQSALPKLRTVIQLYEQAGDNKNQGDALLITGLILNRTGDKNEALKVDNLALAIFRRFGDKKSEAIALNNIGIVYDSLGEKQKALDYYNQSLPLSREVGDKFQEASTLSNSGLIYYVFGEKQKALDNFSQSLTIRRTVGSKSGEAVTLGNIGMVYSAFGEKQKALDYYNQSLVLRREVGDKRGEATTLSNIGQVYDELGEKQKALDYYNQALPITRLTGDQMQQATTLNNIGAVYDSLGNEQKALGYYNQSLLISRSIGDKLGEARTLSNIGVIYDNLGERQKALDVYNQSLLLRREIGDKEGETTALNNIGTVYSLLGNYQKALDYFNQSLQISRKIGDKETEGSTLNSIGVIYEDLGEKQKALDYLQLSISLKRYIGDKGGEANTLNILASLWDKLKNPRLAIFYGKQSINLYQQLRSKITLLDKETQKIYLKSIEYKYRNLADILVEQGRIAEAEQTLAMLKEEEFFDFSRRDDAVAKDLTATISLSQPEKEAFDNYEKFADQITQIGAEFGKLEAQKNALPLGESLPPADQKQYDALKVKLDDANAVFSKYLNELKVKFGQADVRVASLESDTQGILKRLNQPHTAIISTIVGEDRLNLIVTTTDTHRAHTVSVKAADINKLVTEFRAAVKNPNVDPRPLGKKIFDILFPADLQKDLDNIKADTIVWSLDGTLRYVPISAIWDGKGYLVERYNNAVLTLTSRDKISDSISDRTKWQVLGVGVSKETNVTNADGTKINFSALSAVPQELCSIIIDPKKKEFCQSAGIKQAGVIKGLMLPDEEFTLAGFQNFLGRTPVVHIASHFSLNAGNESDSFLLLGGGTERKFSLVNLRNTRLDKVELLVLSACNTAMAAGKNSRGVEVEGFGTLAQNQGAKTVLATLWSVADDSTRDLMTEFYKVLDTNPKIGKAEALRKAQIILLSSETKTENNVKRAEIIGSPEESQGQPPFPFDKNKPFAHPYYWSPFVLIGNWK